MQCVEAGMSIFSLADFKAYLYMKVSDCLPPFFFGNVNSKKKCENFREINFWYLV